MNCRCLVGVNLCLLLLPLALRAQAPTALARAEKRLAQLLQPSAGFESAGLRADPIRWPGPPALEQPSIPLSRYKCVPPRLALPDGKPVLPRPLAEGSPLADKREQPQPPRPVEMPTAPLLRLDSIDAREPLPLPILAQPQKDRASLADPTLAASIAAALRPLTPARAEPLAFAPMNLPDPFENVPTGEIRNPPAEDSMPPAIPLRTPGR
jgi:hypothetical protein